MTVDQDIFSVDRQYILDALPPREELAVVWASGTKIKDAEGRVYTDLFSGIGVNNVGHRHPEVVSAIDSQVRKFMHVSAYYYHEPAARLARRLIEVSPDSLAKVFFCNSGTEAIDGAIKFCKLHAFSRQKGGAAVVALKGSFHGRLSLTLTLTGQRRLKEKLASYANFPGVVHTTCPYHYRYGKGLSEDEFGKVCADEIGDTIENFAPGDVSAVIVEPVLGEGGIIVPPDTFLPRLAKICREKAVPLVADEVQTGFGRTGKMFACENWSVEPDVMALAKALGGGLPLGAILVSNQIAESAKPGDHFNTFFGNPVSCAAGIAVLSVMEKERLPEKAARTGERILSQLSEAEEELPNVGQVRGKGLMIGVELVKDKGTKEPSPDLAKAVKKDMLARGYLVGVGGILKNVVRVQPPLTLTEEDAAKATAELVSSMKRASVD
jgi:4-aminobutyrate aminotransferase